MVIDPSFERRTVDEVRRFTDDIAECDAAEISITYHGPVPVVRFVFGDKRLLGRPALGVQMVTESRKNPLAPGRVIEGDELRRHVRNSVEQYLKLNAIEVTRKAMTHAHL